jgi:hypothetical protein
MLERDCISPRLTENFTTHKYDCNNFCGCCGCIYLLCLPNDWGINGIFLNRPVVIDCAEFGRSFNIPGTMAINVDEKPGPPANIGQKVKKFYFNDSNPFRVTISFCRGPNNSYGNPKSIWFNVFAGYYQVEVSKSLWKRPFGYEDATNRTLNHEELLKLGKSDWNFLSNHIYGVPVKEIQRLAEDDSLVQLTPITIGNKEWDSFELEFNTVAPYVSPHDGKRFEEGWWTPLWRFVFGRPISDPQFKNSFFPSKIKGACFVCFKEDVDYWTGEERYQTLIFGGTINQSFPDHDQNQRFLILQKKVLQQLIVENFSDLGFEFKCDGISNECK